MNATGIRYWERVKAGVGCQLPELLAQVVIREAQEIWVTESSADLPMNSTLYLLCCAFSHSLMPRTSFKENQAMGQQECPRLTFLLCPRYSPHLTLPPTDNGEIKIRSPGAGSLDPPGRRVCLSFLAPEQGRSPLRW